MTWRGAGDLRALEVLCMVLSCCFIHLPQTAEYTTRQENPVATSAPWVQGVGSSFVTNEPSGGGLTLGDFVVGDGGYVRILWEFPSWRSGNESD